MEKNPPVHAQAGMAVFLSSLQIAKVPSINDSERPGPVMPVFYRLPTDAELERGRAETRPRLRAPSGKPQL